MKAGEAPPPYIGKAAEHPLIYGGLAINGAFHAKLLGCIQAIKAKRPPNGAL